MIFYPYARMVITLEDEDFFPAMKRSMHLAIANIKITLKFVIITALLSIRFIFNILLLVGIPLFLIRFGTRLGLDSIPVLQRVFVVIVL